MKHDPALPITDTFTPRDYVIIFQRSRFRPSPHHPKVLKHDKFLKQNGSDFVQHQAKKKRSFSEGSRGRRC